MDDAVYAPSRWGEVFHNLPHNEALGAGSAGPGKSLVLLHEADAQIFTEHKRVYERGHPQKISRSKGWCLHLRRTRPMLDQTIQRSMRAFTAMDPGAKWDAQRTTWTFSSGYKYQFGHCKDPGDWQIYLSNEYSMILYDELVQFDEEQYNMINTRLRSDDPVLMKMLKIRSMSNPVLRREKNEDFSVRDPFWVRKRFVDRCREGKRTFVRKVKMADGSIEKWSWIYWPAKLHDNPNKEFVRVTELGLRMAPPHIRAAMLEGDWYVSPDSFFGAVWNAQLHVCDPFVVPKHWRQFRSMDWGFKKPGCVHWWALDEDENLYCQKEYTFQEKTDAQVADRVKEIEEGMGLWGKKRSLIEGVADTQIWEQRGQGVRSIAETFASKGVFWKPADKKSRRRNFLEIYSRLGDHKDGTTTPGLVFFRTCPRVIATLPAIQTDPKDQDTPMDGGEDHWADSVAYAVAHASRGAMGVGRVRDEDDDRDDEDSPGEQERGRYGYGSSVA